jgi:hypothetical protein
MREGAVWQGRDTTQEIYFVIGRPSADLRGFFFAGVFFFFLATASFLSASRLSIK